VETTRKQEKLIRLHKGIRRCRRCPLYRNRTHAVPGEGPASARIIFIGEAPGREEDLQGLPFVGRSGKFLNSLLESIGLSRQQVYITSSVKCQPLENRTPHIDELMICKLNWLDIQISLINPQIVVLLGKTSLKQILGQIGNLSFFHGQLFHRNGRSYFATFHPAAAMRFPDIRGKTKQDFKKLKGLLASRR
jgi:uracil-DNA glycosylase family 4